MIVHSHEKYKIGELRKGIWGNDWKWYPNMPYKIIGYATREEWIKDAENDMGRKLTDKEMKDCYMDEYFHKISID